MGTLAAPRLQAPTQPLRLKSVLPLRPRFLREVVVLPVENGIFVDGADRSHVFQGEATQGLVQKIIDLADGTRTLRQLEVAAAGVPRGRVREVLSLLFAWGLIEDGSSEAIFASETLSFLRRNVGATRINGSGQEAYERLQASKVVLLSSGSESSLHMDMLASLLENSGIGEVMPLGRESLKGLEGDASFDPEHLLVVSFCVNHEDHDWHAELDSWCHRHGCAWLRAVLDESAGYSDIGPLFKGRQNSCYRCFQAVHARASALPGSAGKEPWQHRALFWTSMVATEIIYMLSRIGPLASGRSFHRYDLGRWTSKKLRCLRVPGCSRCRPDGQAVKEGTEAPSSESLTDTALAFEDHISLSSRDMSAEKEEPGHLRLSLALTRETKYLANCPQHVLSARVPKHDRSMIDILLADPRNTQKALGLDELASILMLTAGIRGDSGRRDVLKRWAATGGNLGSVELFVAARQVEGLEPGFYFYEPKEHSLACFRSTRALGVAEFMSRALPAPASGLPDAIVIFTGAFHRVARKYGPFAYRLINLDAGAALVHLQVVAKSLNVFPQTQTLWADDLIEEQLNLEPQGEQVTAVVTLSGSAMPPPKEKPVLRIRWAGSPEGRSSTKAVGEFGESTLSEIVQMLYHESRVHESDLTRGLSAESETIRVASDQDCLPSTPLPAPVPSWRTVEEVLRSRASIRHYSADPLSVSQLSTMLHCASRGDGQDWPEECARGDSLTYLVVALHVSGLLPGVYAYDSRKHALLLTHPAPSSEERVEMFLQKEFALAPVVIWIAGDLSSTCDRQGAFGHRQLLLRAGSAGQRLWMAAMGSGLSGTLVAGIVAGALEKTLGLDGYKQAGLLAFPVGYGARYFRWPSATGYQSNNRVWQESTNDAGKDESNDLPPTEAL